MRAELRWFWSNSMADKRAICVHSFLSACICVSASLPPERKPKRIQEAPAERLSAVALRSPVWPGQPTHRKMTPAPTRKRTVHVDRDYPDRRRARRRDPRRRSGPAPRRRRRSPRSSAPITTHGVIFFRDQRITPPQQVAFTRRFGEIEFNIFGERWSVPGSPEIVVVSNVTEDGRPIGVRRAGENWHSDMCYAARPPRGTMLYALEIPDLFGLTLGDTEFASAAAAWDALPERDAAADRRATRGVRLHRPQAGLSADPGGNRSQPAGHDIRSFGPIPVPGANASTSCATIAPGSRALNRKQPRR